VRTVPCPLLGAEVGLPDRVERIVSLSPSLTDTVVRLGLRDRLVGRSAWCWRPEGIGRLPVAGSYTGVRREVLKELDPDLILTTSGAQEALARELARAGEPVYVVPVPSTPWGILENLAVVAVAAGEPDAAEKPLEHLHARMESLRGILEPMHVYVEIDLGEAITIGTGSYAYWALQWMGLVPLVPAGGRAWPSPLEQWLEGLRPEAIVYDPRPHGKEEAESIRRHFEERGLGEWFVKDPLLAVTEGDLIAHYGPWLIDEGLPALAKLLSK